ncbi:MAG: ROK family protein [Candidatus Auribacter fodinae]|jgi:glucokinase|uniref:ROK family protein n=1 Tax=Candidatus Auribacter fodinae TaxID=2093366 RepID=A0A3A4QVJ9_9BACT|nr:MAG: ROK family protein [Candidatus Auribacter fodinae]
MGGSTGYAIGIDVGGTSIKLGLVCCDEWNITARTVIHGKDYETPDAFLTSIPAAIEKVCAEAHVRREQVLGIGIGLPGCVDSLRGIVKDITNLPNWRGEFTIKKALESLLGIPTYIDNDVNLMSIAELVRGAGNGCRNMLCVTLGTGVGGAIIIDGKLYRGSTLSAGEIGHITLFKDGEPCNCGNWGCLERYVGNAAIVNRTVRAISESSLKKDILMKSIHNDLSRLTPKIICGAAYDGDELSQHIWEETGSYIGIVFAAMVNVLNPDKIVVGGGVAQCGNMLFKAIRKTINERAMPVPAERVELVPAVLGADAGIYGSAIYSVKTEFHEEIG